jgi:hypothetical protein
MWASTAIRRVKDGTCRTAPLPSDHETGVRSHVMEIDMSDGDYSRAGGVQRTDTATKPDTGSFDLVARTERQLVASGRATLSNA